MSVLTIISNVVNGLKTVEWMGEEYLVCPMTMIVSGVLDGSGGPLYYPPDEIEASVNDWNGMPVVMYHPMVNGFNVSARSPDIMQRHFVGWVFNAEYLKEEEKLVAEAWMKKAKLAEYDEVLDDEHKVLPRLLNGKPVELSTGLYTQNVDGPGTDPKGVAYDNVARQFKPDHLAILPDRLGACPVEAGCGLGVNEGKNPPTPTKEEPMSVSAAKEKLIKWLCTNCSCWKGEDITTLNNFSEAKLKQLKKAAIEGKVLRALAGNGKQKTIAMLVGNNRKLTKNAEGETEAVQGVSFPDLAEFLGITVDAASDPIGFVNALKDALNEVLGRLEQSSPAKEDKPAEEPSGVVMESCDDDEEKTMNKDNDKPTGNRKGNKVTLKDLLASDPEAQRQWATLQAQAKKAEALEANQKKGLVDIILKRLNTNEAARPAVEAAYSKMDIASLVAVVQSMPQPQQVSNGLNPLLGMPGLSTDATGLPLFVGNGGAGFPGAQGGRSEYGNFTANEDDEVYPDPHSHWREAAQGQAAGK